MAFVNPQILQKIFGGAPAAQPGAFDPSTPQGQAMYQMMAGAGAGMSQAAAQPGADFGQSLGGGAAGMMQGQQQAQQMQMNQMKMAQAQREAERQERLGKIMGDILQGPKQDWASQVDARLPQGPQITPLQQNVSPQASRYAGPPDAQRWEAMFPDLKANVVRQESGGRQFAEGGGPLTSSAGALGKMQVMPGTGPDAAELAGLPWDPERLKNDEAYNEALGTAYLNHLGGRYSGDPVLASAAYNWGMGRVDQHNQNVGDPRKGEISHEEWVQSIPNDEAKNYAATVGMPLLGGGGQQQPQQAPAQPQQPQMNGYQQNVAQQQANDPLAGLPQGTRQMLALMDPEDAMKTIVDLQTQGGTEQPADVRTALFMAGGDEELARKIMLAQQAGDGPDESSDEEDIRLFMEANPGATRAQAINAVTGDRYETFVDPLQGTMQRDKITGKVTPIRPEYGPVKFDPERDVPDLGDPDVQSALGVPGLGRNIANTVAGFFNTDELPAQEAERARAMLNNLATRATAAFSLQLPGRASNMQLEMGERLQVRPGQPTMSPAKAREVFDASIRDMKAELDRINTDILDQPGYSSKVYSDARANASQIRRILGETTALRQALDTDPAAGRADPDVDALINRWAD